MSISLFIECTCERCGQLDRREDAVADATYPYGWPHVSMVFPRDEAVGVGRTGRLEMNICPHCADEVRDALGKKP